MGSVAGFILFRFVSTLAIVAFFYFCIILGGVFSVCFSLCDGFAHLGTQLSDRLGSSSP